MTAKLQAAEAEASQKDVAHAAATKTLQQQLVTLQETGSKALAVAMAQMTKMQEGPAAMEKIMAEMEREKKDVTMLPKHYSAEEYVPLLPAASKVPLEEGSEKEKVAFRLYHLLEHWSRMETKVTFSFEALANELGNDALLDEILTDLLGEARYVWVARDCDRSEQVFPPQCTAELQKQVSFWGGKSLGESTAKKNAKEANETFERILTADNKRRKKDGGN